VFRIIATRGSDEIVADAPLSRLPALLAEPETNVWVDLTAPVTDEDIAIVRDVFRFHQLAIEDCFESRAHPKIDEFDGYIYLITHGLASSSTAEDATVVELDAFVGPRYIVTHHALPSRSVTAVMEAVLKTGLPLRRGSVAVLHALLDRQVDGLEETLEHIEERITHLEDAVFARPTDDHLASLLAVKGTILQLRRWISKQREVVLRLGRREFGIVSAEEAMLFRDVHDHLVRITDLLESFREMLTSIQDAYLSVTSNRLNETMKFLTLFTATLMPLTVITGIYGMNFHHMPELDSRWGYPAVMAVMAGVMGLVLLFFRRRGLLGRPPAMPPLQPLPPLQPPRTGMTATMAIQPAESPAADDENRAAMIAADGATPTVSTTPSRGRS
jgi:magnesium transporter